MKFKISVYVILHTCISVTYQNLYNNSNAASLTNESNSNTGWFGAGNISSSNLNPQNGQFSLLVSTTSNNLRDARYTFNVTIGEEYTITIWARSGAQNYRPAFANWSGLNGFSTTSITSTNWEEYTWTVTGTSTTPNIRVYTIPKTGGSTGDSIFHL